MRHLSDIVYHHAPLSLPASETVGAACRQMHRRRIGSVLVTDGERLIGIFTGRDLVQRVVAVGRDPERTTLGETMTPDPVTLGPDNTAIDALRLMWDGGFRHVPILDGGRLRGVVTRGDFNASETTVLEDERYLWEHMR